MSTDLQFSWPALETLVRRDPARRGVSSFTRQGSPLCTGHLAAAAQDLASRATAVALTTGFAVVDGSRVTAETDGPPGTLFLARALAAAGVEIALITDCYARPLLEVGCDALGLSRNVLHEFPLEETPAVASADALHKAPASPRADAWIDQFLSAGIGSRVSHVIAVERVGPSHTSRSFLAQRRDLRAPVDDFERDLPPESRDVCHNMRGISVDAHTGRIHRLFEALAQRGAAAKTIGVGDGGNEIGMGSIPWETLRAAISIGPGGRVACRVPTDFTVLAGVSDWGALALAGSFARLRSSTIDGDDEAALQRLIESMVRDAGAVDGVTARSEATVDGLPSATYLQVYSGIRALCAARSDPSAGS